MLILPAIDLKGGRCVRLAQGCFDAVTEYGDPFAQMRAFAEAGAEWVHVVDLDGARVGRPVQHDLMGGLAHEFGLRIQCGGGVRERRHVAALLDAGVERVVVGSAAVRKTDEVSDWIGEFGLERVCCAFDVRAAGDAFEVAVDGWSAGGGVTLNDALRLYPEGALKHVLITDIARDGVLSGPNAELIRSIAATRKDLRVQASGGVASLADLAELRAAGAAATIVGRALYERRFSLEDALAG
jgi:phosphoribosylformimino-5-aminoimidazole carboxamide ribotide isomerase